MFFTTYRRNNQMSVASVGGGSCSQVLQETARSYCSNRPGEQGGSTCRSRGLDDHQTVSESINTNTVECRYNVA